MADFPFLGSKITTDSDCSHKIKRHLLLRRKAMNNLDSVLKSRGYALLTKVHLVKVVVFSVVMFWMWELGNKEGWTLKNWCFWTVVLEKTLESPLESKEIKPIYPKGNQPWIWIFIGRTDAEAKAPILGRLMQRADSLEKTPVMGQTEGKKRRGQRIRWLDSITDLMDMNLSKLSLAKTLSSESEGQGSLVCYSPWGCKESDTT